MAYRLDMNDRRAWAKWSKQPLVVQYNPSPLLIS